VSSERCSIEEQSIEYCGWACYVVGRGACVPKPVGATIHN
jgi:hypothetical protein